MLKIVLPCAHARAVKRMRRPRRMLGITRVRRMGVSCLGIYIYINAYIYIYIYIYKRVSRVGVVCAGNILPP